MQSDFNEFRSFNYDAASVYLWVFKKSSTSKKFRSYYVRTDEQLDEMLKSAVKKEIGRITEFAGYTYLSEVNECSCLGIGVEGTGFSFLKEQVDQPEIDQVSPSLKNLKGAEGYVVKFVYNDKTVYAVKRSSSSWKTSYSKKVINIVFSNGELKAVEDNSFAIERNFDFYSINNSLFMASKSAFESCMGYRAAYVRAFEDLRAKPEFVNLFSDMQPLIDYVGSNAMHLKRMARIEQKEIYNHPDFLPKLREVSERRGWGLNFDQGGSKIIPCGQTAPTILQVFLDHRLFSEITEYIYDVPDATQLH